MAGNNEVPITCDCLKCDRGNCHVCGDAEAKRVDIRNHKRERLPVFYLCSTFCRGIAWLTFSLTGATMEREEEDEPENRTEPTQEEGSL